MWTKFDKPQIQPKMLTSSTASSEKVKVVTPKKFNVVIPRSEKVKVVIPRSKKIKVVISRSEKVKVVIKKGLL